MSGTSPAVLARAVREVPIGSEEARAAWRWHAFRLPPIPGRITSWIARRMLARSAPTVTVALPFGMRMALDLAEYLQCTIALTGDWEGEIFDTCAPLVAPGTVVLDVGAHVGYGALRLAAMTGRDGRVIAFEPMPGHRAAVERQFALNGVIGQLTLVAAAASDRAGTAAFTAPRGANAGVGALATDGAGSFTVQTLVLDDWLEQNGVDQLALCKMDIEGGEALALPGLARALAAHRVRALLLELHPSELPKFGSSSGAIVARLEGHGYRVRFWEPPGRFEDGPPRGDGTYLLALAPGVAWPPSLR